MELYCISSAGMAFSHKLLRVSYRPHFFHVQSQYFYTVWLLGIHQQKLCGLCMSALEDREVNSSRICWVVSLSLSVSVLSCLCIPDLAPHSLYFTKYS